MPLPTITASRTPRHGLPFLFAGQAQKEAFVNEAFARLDALVQPAVLDELSVPPANPAAGDAYLIGAAPTAAWTGQADAVAVWAESQWLFLGPREGMQVFNIASGGIAVYRDGGWARATVPAAPAGGTTQDAEARAAIAALVAKLHTVGIFCA